MKRVVNLGRRRENAALSKQKVGEFEKELKTLRDAPKANEWKIQGLESQVASDAKTIARLATLVKDRRSSCFHPTAENEELRR